VFVAVALHVKSQVVDLDNR